MTAETGTYRWMAPEVIHKISFTKSESELWLWRMSNVRCGFVAFAVNLWLTLSLSLYLSLIVPLISICRSLFPSLFLISLSFLTLSLHFPAFYSSHLSPSLSHFALFAPGKCKILKYDESKINPPPQPNVHRWILGSQIPPPLPADLSKVSQPILLSSFSQRILLYQFLKVIEHKPYDHKADVFSFAVVLWELLTAKVVSSSFFTKVIIFLVSRN